MVEALLYSQRGRECSSEGLPIPADAELRAIRAHRSVRRDSVRFLQDDENDTVLIDFAVDQPSEPATVDIKSIEPIALVYDRGSVGVCAPAVYSERSSFPRELPHLNYVPETSPVSICLSRVGHPVLYSLGGITFLLERLAGWLADAWAGDLNRAGWEPPPLDFAGSHFWLALDSARFQAEALRLAQNGGGWAAGATFLLHEGGQRRGYGAVGPSVDQDVSPFTIAHDCSFDQPAMTLPWLLVTAQPADTDGSYIRSAPTSFQALQRLLQRHNAKRSLVDGLRAFADSVPAEGKLWCDRVLVLLALRRPKPLYRDIFGLSKNEEARHFELIGFHLEWDENPKMASPSCVSLLGLLPPIGAELMRDVSSTETQVLQPTILGYGALGSLLHDHLLRSGHEVAAIVDNDYLVSHNLARHIAVRDDLFVPKVAVAKRHAEALFKTSSATSYVAARVTSSNTPPELAGPGRLILDCTADEDVRRALAAPHHQTNAVIRTEIFDQGRLGVQFVRPSGADTDLLDLYAELCLAGLNTDVVAQWLANEAALSVDDQTLLLSVSCSSMTVRLPNARVGLHAAAFMPLIEQACSGAALQTGFGLNPISSQGHPLGWSWHSCPAYQEILCEGGWRVRCSDKALTNMICLTEKNSPEETGGYVYGTIHPAQSRMTIVAVSSLPPGSIAGRGSLKMAPAGRTPLEQSLVAICAPRIRLLGSWHSHPGGGLALSGTDHATAERARRINALHDIPTFLMVTNGHDCRGYVVNPDMEARP